MHHDLKTWPKNYNTHDCGITIRKNDRDFQINDTIRSVEWVPGKGLTGRRSPYYLVVGIIRNHVGVKEGYVVLFLDGPWGMRVMEKEV